MRAGGVEAASVFWQAFGQGVLVGPNEGQKDPLECIPAREAQIPQPGLIRVIILAVHF